MVQMVSKQVLEELEVPLPALKQQARIANLFQLATREQQILENIKQSTGALHPSSFNADDTGTRQCQLKP